MDPLHKKKKIKKKKKKDYAQAKLTSMPTYKILTLRVVFAIHV